MRALFLCVLVGCGGEKASDAPIVDQKARCTTAVTKGVDATLLKRATTGVFANNQEYGKKLMEQLGPKLKEAMIGLCVEDKWPEPVLGCFDTSPDVAKCRDLLTVEQRARYASTMMQAMAVMSTGRVTPDQLKH
jgi:hypothetical protein